MQPSLTARKPYLILAALAALCSIAMVAGAGPLDAEAHLKLTDGVRASSSAADPAWLTLQADSTELPQTFYGPDEFCYWGLNLPHDFSPWRTPKQFEMLRDANIRGVRYEIMWAGIQKESRTEFDYNWYLIDHDLNVLLQNGFTVQAMLNTTPYWATGLQGWQNPPNVAVESELVDLSGGSAVLSRSPVLATEPDVYPIVVTPEEPQITRFEEEIISTDFQPGQQPRPANRPVVPGTQQVWLDENDGRGWVLWTPVEHLVDSPFGSEHYQFDRSGRVKFRYKPQFENHGKTPAPGSRVKISYDAYTGKLYQPNLDYTLDRLTGTITRLPGAISGANPVEEFAGTQLGSGWQWMNEPVSWDIGTTRDGHLHFTVNRSLSDVGHFLYQQLNGDGDFTASVRVTKSALSGSGQTGLAVYQDASNWFRFSLSTDAGRPLLTRCINGTVTTYGRSGEIGFAVWPPRWLTARKVGGKFTVFTSATNPNATDGGYQHYYTFDFPLSFPLKVGIAAAGVDAAGSDIDSFLLTAPSIPPDAKVRVSYNAMDTAPFQAFCRNVVGRFKGRIKHWEIFNEPDQYWVWRGGQDLYSIFLRDAAQAIHEADPDAIVVSGGYSDSGTGNLQTIYNTVGGVFDMAAWHPYLFTNKPPDAVNWLYGGPNGGGRSIMVANGDAAKQVFLGEVSASSGVLGSGGGLTDARQAEYGLRQLMLSRRLSYVKGVQWWPAFDLSPVGVKEDDIFGGHNGFFFNASETPKPVFYAYRTAATNKGILLDLAGYDSQGNRIPAGGSYQISGVSVGVQDRSAVQRIRVLTSLTATDARSRPAAVAARHIGQAGAPAFAVSVNTASHDLRTETWTLQAVSPLGFTVTGSVSGEAGLAEVAEPFSNGLVGFTIPIAPKPYVAGDRFVCETFAGDGLSLAGEWVNDGALSGDGEIEIPLPGSPSARYVSVEFVRADGASQILVDEVRVLDTGGGNLAAGKVYLVDGYQGPAGWEAPVKATAGEAWGMPDGSWISMGGLHLTAARDGIAFVQQSDRARGMRVEGGITAKQGEVVSLIGEMATKPWGERFIQLKALWATDKEEARPLVCSSRSLASGLADGLLVRVFGTVAPGSVQPDSFMLLDGHGSGLRVFTAAPPEVTEGEFVAVDGAAGYDANGVRAVYSPIPPETPEP